MATLQDVSMVPASFFSASWYFPASNAVADVILNCDEVPSFSIMMWSDLGISFPFLLQMMKGDGMPSKLTCKMTSSPIILNKSSIFLLVITGGTSEEKLIKHILVN